ncbi:MAG: hypothetical protein HZR80_16090 [Candidatus Heimdallarchaeota archaeon]
MNESAENNSDSRKKRPIRDSLLGGEGISDVEEKRIKMEEKKASKYFIEDSEKEEFLKQIKRGLSFSMDFKDVLIYILAQFLPLLALGAACLVPGIIYLPNDLSALILIVLAGFAFLYAILRVIFACSYKIDVTTIAIKWRSIFRWKEIPNVSIDCVNAMQGNYCYLIKIKGFLRYGVEVIQIVSDEKEHWIRAYPLRKSKGDQLVKTLICWAELTKANREKKD